MKLPIIGITCRVIDNISKVPNSLVEYIKRLNGITIIIPQMDDNKLNEIIKLFDGFIIPGGQTFTKTDEFIINYAIDNDVPLIGICAGMQAIGCLRYFGSEISDQSIPTNSAINHHEVDKKYVHDIIINDGLLKDILNKSSITVNSRHYNKVKDDNLFIIDAISTDNVIEAIHIPNKKMILGVQWHPEDLDDENSIKLFNYFLEICKGKEK